MGGRRRIDGVVRGRFLAVLEAGGTARDAAQAAGFSLRSLYAARARDPAFLAAWSKAARTTVKEVRVAPSNKGRLQLRRRSNVRLTAARRAAFLAHLADTCDTKAGAAAAGVDASSIYRLRRRDPAFAARFQEALDEGYGRLEAEALRQRMAAQQQQRAEPPPAGEIAAEFERVMKLLAYWQRRGGRAASHRTAETQSDIWTFEAAVDALAERLRALDIPVAALAPSTSLPPSSSSSPPTLPLTPEAE